ncbi:hypothetical protein HG536_0C01980 [Torulaspora globosa]|uniref:Bud site selection protein RAX2 n=1 Tax=Torulaspora globosa TaxID=48254 RepID=A0A7G3ZEU4_9SACH|nr:uncharacterized protein HG536_0C01980 [Torulaspora globosa]QLL32030.1 hypothetical protein HG536_0C01980 [Torulaspora globosa]
MSIAGFLYLLCEFICFSVASQLENLRRAYNVTSIEPKQLDFSQGFLQVFGDFDTLTFPRYEGQQNFTQEITSDSGSRDIIYYSNDIFIKLIEGSSDTNVRQIVPFGSDSFILSGSGRLLGFELERQIFYNLSDLSLRPMFDHSLGEVKTILVDDSLVYFGGNFTYDHGVAIWNYTSNTTFQAPFGGFGSNSQVNSIVKLDDDNILFTGSFAALDNQTWWNSVYRNTSGPTNIEAGSLIPLQWAAWDAGSSSFFDASQFICPNPEASAWLASSSSGSLGCFLPFEVAAQKIRIFNSPSDDSGVSLFRIITKPSGGIMNLTYVDPLSGEMRYCDAFCPLLKRSALREVGATTNSTQGIMTNNNLTSIQWSENFQDFAFVNQISVSELQFLAVSSYGNAVGLSSLQLYSGTVSVYANDTLNDPGCGSDVVRSSSFLSNNSWHDGLPQKSYLITQFDYGTGVGPKVTFYPEVKEAGQYTVNVYTPGCLADNTCSSRSIVNVTMRSSNDDSILASILLYQNNLEEKYDQLYSGHLESPPIVILEFSSGIQLNSPSNVVVADRIELIPHAVDALANQTEENFLLNGMFLYQLSNITDKSGQNSSSIGNSSLNSFAVQNFPQNSSLVSIMYNSTLWVGGGTVSGVATIDLGDDFSISSSDRLNTGGSVEGMSSYSEGILMFGNFNLSSKPLSTITYNGSFNSFGNLNTSIKTFSNISLHGTELLVFNNEFIFNTTSNEYISNSSAFGLSLWSAGQNSFNDILFCGAVSETQYTGLDGSAEIFTNGSVVPMNTSGDMKPYLALKLNDTTTVHAYGGDTLSQLMFNDGSHGPWSWFGTINLMRYMNDGTMLAIVVNNPSGESQLNLLNLTNFNVARNLTMAKDSYISSAVFFGRNSSLLMGGNFSIPGSQCVDLCLYNYDQNQWSKVANGSVNGNITEMKLSNTYDLLISGVINFNNRTSVNLASFNMTSHELNPLLSGSDKPLKSFIEGEYDLLVWNETNLLNYRASKWEDIELGYDSISVIETVIALNGTAALEKREDSGSKLGSILLAGRLNSVVASNLTEVSIYDFERWSPYYLAGSDNNGLSSMAFFTGEEFSNIYDSQSYLPNSGSATTSVPSASQTALSSPTATVISGKRRRIDRGYVVLIGLALALGTVTVLGITGVLLALLFKFDSGYEQVVPRIDENEMMESVPPEKLLEFL